MLYTTFYIDDTRYGIPILAVQEVSRPIPITSVPGTDARIEGLLNLRGQIVTVLNLGSCLELRPVRSVPTSRLVILKTEKALTAEAADHGIHTAREPIALLVDRAGEVVDAGEKESEPVSGHVTHAFISGVIKLNEELLVLLAPDRLTHLRLTGNEHYE